MKKMIFYSAMFAVLMMVSGCEPYRAEPVPAPAPGPAPVPAPEPEPTFEEPVNTTDQAIYNDVYRALQKAPGIDASTILVRVENGNVFLSGWVRSAAERSIAHNVAHSVDGVRRVFYEDLGIR